MKSTKNFKEHEWKCKCGCDQPHNMVPFVMNKVQTLRERYGHPLTLSSAWRCENHPSEARKSKPGQHFLGTAVDIRVTSGAMAYTIIKLGLELGATGFAYGNGFVHLDWRESTPVSWIY